MAYMMTARPARKVIVASIASAIAMTSLSVFRAYPVDIMPFIVADSLLAAAVAFVAGYLVSPADRDRAIPSSMLPS